MSTIDLTLADFEDTVTGPGITLVDYWAAWCGPCKALKPVLEKLATEYQGQFVLAKIDTDAHPDLASRFGIRGIPNVKAMVDGKVVSEFSGALPESAVRAFLAKVLPSPAEKLRQEARRATAEGDSETAEAHLREAMTLDGAKLDTRLDLIDLLIARQAYAEADLEMQQVPERERDARAESLASRIALWIRTQSLPDAADLERAVASNPDDIEARLGLAERRVADREYEKALEQLLEVVRRNRGEARDRARKLMVEVFGLCVDQPFVAQYRRLLASALY